MTQSSTHPRPEVPPLASSALPARRVETLPGGMTATLVSAGVVPIAAIRLVVHAGSAHVPAGQTWLDRLVHEYLREGTQSRDAEAFASALAALGGRLDIDGDAHTTTISTEVPSEHAPAAVTLLAELARTPRFPAGSAKRLLEDLERTLDIAGSQPQWLAHAGFRQALYGDHPYGRVLPTAEDLAALNVDRARAFWSERAGLASTRLMAAGLFDEDAVLQAARAGFEGWSEGAAASVPPSEVETARVIRIVDRPGAEQTTLQIGRRVPAPGHDDYVAFEVLNALLGGSFYSRITLNIREDKGYTYSPRSSVSSRPGDAYWVQAADVTTAVTGASLREILGEIDRLRAEPPSEAELAGILNYVAGAFVIRQATPGGILNHLEFLDLHGLDASYSASYVTKVREVTPSEVQRLAQAYLDPAGMPIILVGDRSAIEAQVAEFGPVEE
ncbi:MAG: insulinase family protein [Dehalococcoidia bacterium]|nr:insulinase family protein [Dehalococcoidia bacterium]